MDTAQEATAGTDTRAAPVPSEKHDTEAGATRRKGKAAMNNIDINKAGRDLLEVRAMIRELEAEAEALTDAIKAEMVERGTETLSGDGWAASWKNVTSSRFDSKAFRGSHPDLYQAFSKPTTSTRFLISA